MTNLRITLLKCLPFLLYELKELLWAYIFVEGHLHALNRCPHFLPADNQLVLTKEQVVLLKSVYQCRCTEHGSVHPGPGLCLLQSGSASSRLALSAAGQVGDAGGEPDGTWPDENAQSVTPHRETPWSWRSHRRSLYWRTVETTGWQKHRKWGRLDRDRTMLRTSAGHSADIH